MRFECVKNVWSEPVHCVNEQQAREKFQCDDCKNYPAACFGHGEVDTKNLSVDDKVRYEFARMEMRQPESKSYKLRLIRKYSSEIMDAIKRGYTYAEIIDTLRKAGIAEISRSTIYRLVREVEAESLKRGV